MSKVILSLLVILVWCPNSFATTYYVSKQGNDENSGTSWATAWATIDAVNAGMSGGDTVYFGTGRYRGHIIPVSGTKNDRTVYACSSFVEGIADIWSSDSMSGWVQHSGNVYKTHFDSVKYYIWYDTYFPGDGKIPHVVGQKDGTHDTVLSPVGPDGASRLLDSLDHEGEFYWNDAKDTIYVWRYGGGNPSSSDIEVTIGPCVKFKGQDYVTIWGFNFRYGEPGGVYWDNGYPGSNYNVIAHCTFDKIGCMRGMNVGACMSNGGASPDSIHCSHSNRITACTSRQVKEWAKSWNPGWPEAQSGGFKFYSQWRMVVESCTVLGPCYDGIDMKSRCHYTVLRFNAISGTGEIGIHINCTPQVDSIYGNIIRNTTTPWQGEWEGIFISGCDVDSSHFVFNNTIYNAHTDAINIGASGPPEGSGNYVRYNVIASPGRYHVGMWSNSQGVYNFDSNMYYPPTNSFAVGSPVNWSTWRNTYGFDARGTNNVDPGFVNVNAIDPWVGFARPASSGEMNLTYGGRTWTVLGAVQPGGSVPLDTIPPNQIQDVEVGTITPTSATIMWTTILLSAPQVCFGQSTSLGQCTPEDPAYALSHSMVLTDLESNTTYYYQPIIRDRYGREVSGPVLSFSTLQSDVQTAEPGQTLTAADAVPDGWISNESDPLAARESYRVFPSAGILADRSWTHLMLWR